MLVNFAQAEAVIERLPGLSQPIVDVENYDWIKDELTSEIRPLLSEIRELLLIIRNSFGCGYRDTTYRDLLAVELRHHGLNYEPATWVRPTFHERDLPTSVITPMIVNRSILIDVQAIQDDISATAIRTMQTHLRLTGCRIGLIVSFGKTRFLIRGVRCCRS